MEQEAKIVDGVFKCPVCGGGLNVIVGVNGREVCRKCLIPIVTERKAPGFDTCEWGYLGQDASKNAMYGRVGLEVRDVCEQPKGYEATVQDGKITDATELPAWGDIKPRKEYKCETNKMLVLIKIQISDLPEKQISVEKNYPKLDRKMTEEELDIFMEDLLDVASHVGGEIARQMQGLLSEKKLI